MSESLRRFGNFLLVIGLFFLLLFFASDQSENPQFGMFFGGMLLSILGFYMNRRFRPRAEPTSDRFRLLRRISDKSKKKK